MSIPSVPVEESLTSIVGLFKPWPWFEFAIISLAIFGVDALRPCPSPSPKGSGLICGLT